MAKKAGPNPTPLGPNANTVLEQRVADFRLP